MDPKIYKPSIYKGAGIYKPGAGGGGGEAKYPNIGYFNIGSNSYKYCQIGDLYIMAQNLREPIGTEGVNYVIPTGRDPELYGVYYYDATIHGTDGFCTQALQDVVNQCPPGWRFPNSEDLVYIEKRIKPLSVDINGWNPFGFDARKCGAYENGSITSPSSLFVQGNPINHATGQRRSFLEIKWGTDNTNMYTNTSWQSDASTVRFVKDV